jgi:hypothetical protein
VLLNCFGAAIEPLYLIIVGVCGTAVGSVATYFIFNRCRSKIISELSYTAIESTGARPTDSEKHAFFQTLNFSSDDEILAHLRIGLAVGCELFLDVSFPQFIVETHDALKLRLAIAETLSFLGKCSSLGKA